MKLARVADVRQTISPRHTLGWGQTTQCQATCTTHGLAHRAMLPHCLG
jgi:hypothetical protein